jgi:hypothetical protein
MRDFSPCKARIVSPNSQIPFDFGDWYGACPYSGPRGNSRLEENNQ